MQRAITTIRNRLGLHARPAMAFVEEAMRFTANVSVRRCDSDEAVDGKSILQMLMLAGTCGSEIEITAIGADESATLAALLALIDANFGEEE